MSWVEIDLIVFQGVVKAHVEDLLFCVEPLDRADVAVKNALVVVVFDLHDLVPHPELGLAMAVRLTVRVEALLQPLVEVERAGLAAVHGRKHLDVGAAIPPPIAG